MTLEEMITKWERIKSRIEEDSFKVGPRIKGDIEVAGDIIRDLRSIEEHHESPQKLSYVLKQKVLEKMHKTIDSNNFNDVLTLSHVLCTLK